MKSLLLYFIFNIFTFTNVDVNSIDQNFIDNFHDLNTRVEEDRFIEKYQDGTISQLAYVTALRMKRAKYAFMPWNKFMIFKEEKNNLEQLVLDNPQDIHLRYIRLMIQQRAPSFLGYNKSIESDLTFIKTKMEVEDDTDFMDYYIQKNISL